MKVTDIYLNQTPAAIREALEAANKRVKQLEAENQRLRKQLEKTRTQNKQQRQRMRSQAGQLKAARAKVQRLRISLSKVKTAVKRVSKPIISVTKRTRAQYLTEKKPEFIRRFIQRLHETYPDFDVKWDETVRVALMSLNWDEIDAVITYDLNLASMYYASNGYAVNKAATGRKIYEYFVQFIPQPAA